MKFVVDTHTHTVSSGHAYSTIQEIAKEAVENKIEMLAMTDHGPSMQGAPIIWHFGNLRAIPPILYGVKVLKGVEANIVDYMGNTDMPERYLERLDFVLAGLHDVCLEPSSVENHTQALIHALKNPHIDAISHPGNSEFQIEIEMFVKAVKEYNKLVEINNHSFQVRPGSGENCREIALQCKKHGVRIICGSDAHISFGVGKFDYVKALLEDIGMPEELVLSTSVGKMEAYLEERQARIGK